MLCALNLCRDLLGDSHIVGDYRQCFPCVFKFILIPQYMITPVHQHSHGTCYTFALSSLFCLPVSRQHNDPLGLAKYIILFDNMNHTACFPSGWFEHDFFLYRWAGSWGIDADFVAKTKCCIICISSEDIKVESRKIGVNQVFGLNSPLDMKGCLGL